MICQRSNRPRTVVHLNVADFAVAVERMVDRRLKERPVIIAPEGAARAIRSNLGSFLSIEPAAGRWVALQKLATQKLNPAVLPALNIEHRTLNPESEASHRHFT